MLRIKLKYKKGEEIKFTSHRDVMRLVQRAIRRTDIPMLYSQGFNPHMKISWGQALKLGKTSDNEFMELHLEQWARPREIMEKLNHELPPGIEILEAYVI